MAIIRNQTVFWPVMWAAVCLACTGEARAASPSGTTDASTGRPDAEYHTPLAGESFHTVFMGEPVDVPAQDRGHITALTLGATYYTPEQGSTTGSPIGAVYIKRVWEDSRTRDIISLAVNNLEYEKSVGNIEFVGLFDNYTIPVAEKIVLNNQEIKQSSLKWGDLFVSVGPGLRYKVAPFQIDNDLRLQLLGRVGYFYNKRTSDTSAALLLPPNTPLYGVKLRGRYDGMRRNLLELPHEGIAAGFDMDYTHRSNWADQGVPGVGLATKDDTQNYVQASAYVMAVGGIPGLSEKNRVLASLHAGGMDKKSADRFNVFRIGDGPFPSESDDLYRVDYPGTMFNQILVSDYAVATVEYRRELAFFMYLHLRGSFIWAHQAAVSNTNQIEFRANNGQAGTLGLDTGFFWNSEIYLAYSYDSGFIRNGKPGSGIILTWNKSF